MNMEKVTFRFSNRDAAWNAMRDLNGEETTTAGFPQYHKENGKEFYTVEVIQEAEEYQEEGPWYGSWGV